MSGWHLTQLTFGSDAGCFYAHSYYDIPVMDAAGQRIAGVQTRFTGRHPTAEDVVEVGVVDADVPGSWRAVGRSAAWSWQQGPMAQWVPGRDALLWSDRENGRHVARMATSDGRLLATLPRPAYALSPDGRFALSLNMSRLNALRPGYGYAEEEGAPAALDPVPEEDGVWLMPLDGEEPPRLVLPLARAVAALRRLAPWRLRLRHRLSRFHFWFNHVKIAPGGRRFTVKLRWRHPGGPWKGRMGVSLTCGIDGKDVRLLAPATSHVIWLDDERLHFFSEARGVVLLLRDDRPRGHELGTVGEGVIGGNVHLRHLPPGPREGLPRSWLFDTPYAETVELREMGPQGESPATIATFGGHVPARGPFRCDLHPVPDADGNRVVVTSMRDGGRQVYVLDRER